MTLLSSSEQLLYATTKITAVVNGVPASTGTGFYFGFNLDGSQYAPALVTNKHVLEGASEIRFTVHTQNAEGTGPSGKSREVQMVYSGTGRVDHPDPNVDLCALTVAGLSYRQDSVEKFFYTHLTHEMIPTEQEWLDFDALEDVVMVGCPRGIYDETNSLPIMRSGSTSSALNKMYEGRPEFLVDVACFPGSSGSPVLLFNRNGWWDRSQNVTIIGKPRVKLLGVLYAGPMMTSQGKVVLARPPSFEVQTMMHLGTVIRSSELLVLNDAIRRARAGQGRIAG